jgi:imidazolonepropionase-like amidohydrolase
MRKIITILAMLLLAAAALAYDYVPGAPQSKPILLKGGTLYTITNGVLKQTDLLFDNGHITMIGENLDAPADAEIIDVTGKRVYPGLIDAGSVVGLIEIGAVRATDDRSEVGRIHPEVQAHVAYNPDSEIIPSVRISGVTTVLVAPQGGVLSGSSSLINLDGWTWEDAAEKINVGMHLNWPRQGVARAWWMEDSAEQQKKINARNRREMEQAFKDAKVYYHARLTDPTTNIDLRWEALLPVFRHEAPLFVRAGDYRQIEQAVGFARENDIRMVLVGGRDAWMLTDLLRERQIPVVLGRVQSLPRREDEPYDLEYHLPALLADAGVKICFSSGFSATGSRNLPFQAGEAVAFGLSEEDALRGLTLSAAEICGVADSIGSLEIGKKATLFISDGDILDPLGNHVVLEYIEGRQVVLDNKHRELYRKYRVRQ